MNTEVLNEVANVYGMVVDDMYAEDIKKVLIDVKGILNKNEYLDADYLYWRL